MYEIFIVSLLTKGSEYVRCAVGFLDEGDGGSRFGIISNIKSKSG